MAERKRPDGPNIGSLSAVDGAQLGLLGAAGLGAGFINGVAGGGSLVSFPVLLAIGLPALNANVTSTVGIWSGYVGGSAGFRSEISTQRENLRKLAVPTLAGSVAGVVLLLGTPASAFSTLAPYLILIACGLFALQPLLSRHLQARRKPGAGRPVLLLDLPVFLASTYGSYFGAGLGVLLLGILGSLLPEDLKKISGLRSAMSLVINTIAAVAFIAFAPVSWSAAGVMAGGSLAGGYLGSLFAKWVPTSVLRVLVIAVGLAAAGRLLA